MIRVVESIGWSEGRRIRWAGWTMHLLRVRSTSRPLEDDSSKTAESEKAPSEIWRLELGTGAAWRAPYPRFFTRKPSF